MDEVLKRLDQQHILVKIRTVNKRYPRSFWLDRKENVLRYDGSTKFNKGRCFYPLADVKEIREGFKTDVFRKCRGSDLDDRENCLFSLIMGDLHESLDLVAESPDIRKLWVQGLRFLTSRDASSETYSEMRKGWIQTSFHKADQSGDGLLAFDEITKLLKDMHVGMEEGTVRHYFELADRQKDHSKKGDPALNMNEFEAFFDLLTHREDLMQLLKSISGGRHFLDITSSVDLNSMAFFLHSIQKQPHVTVDLCSMYVGEFEICDESRVKGILTIEGFREFMMSPVNDVFNPLHAIVYQDMSQPLTHYFINSSHNTYLLEDQLMGRSSVEAYIRALKMGCRCVEADCHDGDDDTPIVYHKYTLVDKIPFADVVRAVRDYAFERSPYPVILNIENHCSIEQQDSMADILQDILGAMLYTTQLSPDTEELPSPEQLKGKILIRAKKLAPVDADELEEDDDQDDNKPKTRVKVSKKFSDLVCIFQNASFISFANAMEKFKCYHGSSIAEPKAEDLIKDDALSFVQHNTNFTTRIYPASLRQDSSNYNPVPFWTVGCQIVALNFQTSAEEMQLNAGKFIDNGNCGYTLKPIFLRQRDTDFDPRMEELVPLLFRVKIISGQSLIHDSSRDILDPYIRVHIHGIPIDCDQKKTDVIQDNGFNPEWNADMEFRIHAPELAIVHFIVRDFDAGSSNDTVAQYALPFNSLQEGYRHIHLKDKTGKPLPYSSLFIYSEVTEVEDTKM